MITTLRSQKQILNVAALPQNDTIISKIENGISCVVTKAKSLHATAKAKQRKNKKKKHTHTRKKRKRERTKEKRKNITSYEKQPTAALYYEISFC